MIQVKGQEQKHLKKMSKNILKKYDTAEKQMICLYLKNIGVKKHPLWVRKPTLASFGIIPVASTPPPPGQKLHSGFSPRQGDARGNADARSSTDACLS